MNGWLNMGLRTAQLFWHRNNANGLSANEHPDVSGSTESTTGYLQDTGANLAVVLQAKSLLARSVQSVRVTSVEEFKELLKTDNALPNDTLYVIEDSLSFNDDHQLTGFAGNL